jgi:hypothetical protein
MNPLQVACSAWLSSCVAVAARLGVADHLAAGPRSAGELARITGTSAPILDRLLRTLAAAGIFAPIGDCYANSADSELLRVDHPRSVRHFCMLAGTEYYRAFGELAHTVDTGQPAFRHVYHDSIYAYMERNADAANTYDRAMEELARPVGEALAQLIDFHAAVNVIDIGGGRGALLRPLLRAHPHLRGISFDREDVCRRAETGDRLQFVAGDFFAGVPAGGDVYILKNVLHNWNDDSASAILRTIAASMNTARLLVIEPLLDEHETSLPKLLDDLMQAVICEQGTSARTEPAMRALLDRASLAVTSVTPLPTGHSAIEAITASR